MTRQQPPEDVPEQEPPQHGIRGRQAYSTEE